MARFGKLLQYFLPLNPHKDLLINRITCRTKSTFKSTNEKLKSMNIPERPRRPLTPYFRFINEHRLKLKDKQPKLRVTEIIKQCSIDWKNFDPDKKTQYAIEYQKELEVYAKQHNDYIDSLTEEQVDAIKEAKAEKREIRLRLATKKMERESGKPKRYASSFIHFIKDKRLLDDNKDMKYLDVVKKYGVEWKNLSEADKQPYIDRHKQDQEQYDQELEKWEKKMIQEGNFDVIRKSSKVISLKPTALPKSKKDDSK